MTTFPSARPLLALRQMVGVLCLALLVRAGVFVANHPYPPLAKDDSVYDTLAWNMISGNGFSNSATQPFEPVAFRTPGYPAFLGLVYLGAGRNPDAVRFAQLGLSLVTCFLIYLLALRVLAPRSAVLAAGLYALSPAAALYPSLVLTEANQALLLTLAVYCAYRCADERGRTWPFVWTALIVAYATLCRPDYQFLIVPLLAVVWLVTPWKSRLVPRVALALACFGAVIAPWILRNYLVFHEYIGLASGTGHTAVAARLEAEGKTGTTLYKALESRYGAAFERKYGRRMTYIDGARPDQDELRRRDFVAFVKSEPWTYARQSIERLYLLWQPRSWSDAAGLEEDFSEYSSQKRYASVAVKAGMLVWDALVLALAVIGVSFGLIEWKRFGLILVVLVYLSAVYSLVYSGARYRIPALPLVVVFAAHGAVRLRGLLAGRLPRGARRWAGRSEPAVLGS